MILTEGLTWCLEPWVEINGQISFLLYRVNEHSIFLGPQAGVTERLRRAGTANKECHISGQIQVLSLLNGHKHTREEAFEWINNPQNTTAWDASIRVHTGLLLISPKHFSSLFYPWESLCLLSLLLGPGHLSSTFGVNTWGWPVMRHPQAPWGGLASPPKQLWERQIQAETCDQAGSSRFPSLWCARMAPWRNPFPERHEGTVPAWGSQAVSLILTPLKVRNQFKFV